MAFLPPFFDVKLTGRSGLHDNGYATTLSHLQTEGLSEKLIFLRGYSQIAFQLRGYEIPECTIPGVFMTQKMPVKLNSRRFATGSFQAQPSPSSQPQQNLPYPQFQPNPSFTPPQPSPFSQPQPNLPYIPFQSNPSFTPPQPSPPFSPPIPTASPFQPRSTPTSPAYITQVVPPLSPVKFFDPTIVCFPLLDDLELIVRHPRNPIETASTQTGSV